MAGKLVRGMTGVMMALVLSAGVAMAQTTSQDKDFLKTTAEDTNYEIKTGQLALKKSQSADVKSYARMVISDHTGLKPRIVAAENAAKVTPEGADSLSISDRAAYTKLELLSGKTFDESYIKSLVKGNQEAVDQTKAEANSSVPAVKALAQRRAALDTKHTEKAKQLAQAHGISAQ